MEKIKNASFDSKKTFKLPAGASIISKEVTLRVEEIENGFIIKKNYDLKWKSKGKDAPNYEYFSKSWYSKENPIQVDETAAKDLADNFE